MPNLITSDNQLRLYLPNMVQTVKGEMPFIERLSNFLDLAEGWVISTFTSKPVFDEICSRDDDDEIKQITARLVAAEAMRRAIPSLDLVLTPNGFGIVNSTNIAPASAERVSRLIDSMVKERDECIAALLPLLPGVEGWLVSERAEYFGATLFPTLDVVDETADRPGSKWNRYIELHQKIFDLEGSLAEEWFSPELMARLRKENIQGQLYGKRKIIANRIKVQIVSYLKSGFLNSRLLADIVNDIRYDKVNFKEWHTSDTAKLFSPPVFRNKKDAPGYFF